MNPLSNSKFMQIMAFYFILSFLIGPMIGYYALGKSIKSVGDGWVAGSVLSIVLWYSVGKKMVA
jgi:hypothetical protein